jgi:hypothetical protein
MKTYLVGHKIKARLCDQCFLRIVNHSDIEHYKDLIDDDGVIELGHREYNTITDSHISFLIGQNR